jgi:hypothetical protein
MSLTLHTNLNGESALLVLWRNSYLTLVNLRLLKGTNKGFCFLLFGILTDTVFVESTGSSVTQYFITTKEGLLDFKKSFLSSSHFLLLLLLNHCHSFPFPS